MIAEVLGRLVLLLAPQVLGADVMLAVGLLAVVLAFAAATRAVTAEAPTRAVAATVFAELRVRLRASDPSAAGHRRARAPGSTR